eukprot:TRINITY_DN3381_c0_g2_i3.p1 TRINITY_DN3381_c0_g2~~TRINITY_DN3381_c0_g2_i3.p1  ORF type:complete len:1888 (+),score=338.22 TRINITY_DN3381_c0_g2_i3:475-5664(+)
MWPQYYSSLTGKGEVEKASELVLDVQSYATPYLESYFKADKRVTIAHLWKCFLRSKSRNKDPSMMSSAKAMFLETIDALLRVHTNWSIERCRSLNDLKYVLWLTPNDQIINKADVVEKATQLEQQDDTVFGPMFRWHSVNREPNVHTLLKQIVSSCPIGFPRHATSCFDSKISEDLCSHLGPKGSIPSIKQSGCSIGKQQHKIFNVREELGRALHEGGGYSTAKDPLFYPSKRNRFLEKRKPPYDEELVNTDRTDIITLIKVRNKMYESRREDRDYYLSGYLSWDKNVGTLKKIPLQWLPRDSSEEKRKREEPNDSVEAQQKRTKYWGALHLGQQQQQQAENSHPAQREANTPISQNNEMADKARGNMSRAFLTGEVMAHIQKKKVASSIELRRIVRESRLLGKMMLDLVNSGKLESHIQTMQHYSGLLKYTLYSLPDADLEDPVVQKEIQTIEDTWAATPAQREKREQVPHLLDEIEKLKAPGMELCPEKYQDCEKLYWLSRLPSQIATLGELTQDPVERKLWVLARAEYKSYWAIRNGKATGQMYRARLLHSYIWNLPQPKAKWTIKELVKGMPLECYAEIIGLEVNPSDFLGKQVTDQDWSTPIILVYRRLHDYIMKFFDKPKSCVSFLNLIEIMAHLGIIKRVGETLKVGCHRGVYLSSSFQVSEETTFRNVISPQLQQLVGTPSDFFLEPSLAGGTTDQTRDSLIRYYWDCLKKCCCYKDAKPTVDFPVLARLISDTILGSARLWDGIVEIPNWVKTKIETFKHYYPLPPGKDEYCPADIAVYVNASQARVNYKSAVGHIVQVRQVTAPAVKSGFDQLIKTRAPRKAPKKAIKKIDKKEGKKSKKKRKKVSEEVNELAKKKIGGWISAEQQVQWMYTIFHVGFGNIMTKQRSIDVIKVLRENKRLPTVCKLLGETESSFTRRWCRIVEKKYISQLMFRATMAREYNHSAGYHLSLGMREFISEVYHPIFHRGYITLPNKMSELRTKYGIISHKITPNDDYKKLRDDQREMHPIELAAMEAVKVVNLCPDIDYDVPTAKAILQPYDNIVLKKVLSHMQGRARGEGRNLLKQVRTQAGVASQRRYQFTASAEECMFPRKRGLHHYQESWSMQQHINDNEVFYPHEVLEGGHIAHIAEQYSGGRLSLHPEGIWRLPKQMTRGPGRHDRLTMGSFVSGLTGSKRGRKQDVYYLQDGIRCTKIDSSDPYVGDNLYKDVSTAIPISGLYLDLCKTYKTSSEADTHVEKEERELRADQLKTHRCVRDDLTGAMGHFVEEKHDDLMLEATDRNIPLLEFLQQQDLDDDLEEEEEEEEEGTSYRTDDKSSLSTCRHHLEPFHDVLKELILSETTTAIAEHLEEVPDLLKYLITTRPILYIYYPFLEQLLTPEELESQNVELFFLVAANYISRLLQQQPSHFSGFKASDIVLIFRKALADWYKLPEDKEQLLISATGVLTTPLLSMLGSVGSIIMIPGPMFAVYLPKQIGTCCFFPITAVSKNVEKRKLRDIQNSATTAGIAVVSAFIPIVLAQVRLEDVFKAAVAGALAIVQSCSSLDDVDIPDIVTVKFPQPKDRLVAKAINSAAWRLNAIKKKGDYRTDYDLGEANRGSSTAASVSRLMSIFLDGNGEISRERLNWCIVSIFDFVHDRPGSTLAMISLVMPLFSIHSLKEVLDLMVGCEILTTGICSVATEDSPIGLFSCRKSVPKTLCYFPVIGATERVPHIAKLMFTLK